MRAVRSPTLGAMASRCAPHSAASPPHRMTRPRWQCSGSRPGAAPIPPSASLPEDRYRPVNTALDSAAGSWHSARLSILSPRARHATRTRTHPPAPRTREPEPRPAIRRFCTNDFRPRTPEPGPATTSRISVQTNSILERSNPTTRLGGRNARTNPPSARPNPRRPRTSHPLSP